MNLSNHEFRTLQVTRIHKKQTGSIFTASNPSQPRKGSMDRPPTHFQCIGWWPYYTTFQDYMQMSFFCNNLRNCSQYPVKLCMEYEPTLGCAGRKFRGSLRIRKQMPAILSHARRVHCTSLYATTPKHHVRIQFKAESQQNRHRICI